MSYSGSEACLDAAYFNDFLTPRLQPYSGEPVCLTYEQEKERINEMFRNAIKAPSVKINYVDEKQPDKYYITQETLNINRHILHRIVALRDIPEMHVRSGDKGGWIETSWNLAQNGNAWIFDEAAVFDNARVSENAIICDNAMVFESACVYGNAFICNKAKIYGDARISGNAQVRDCAEIADRVYLYGNDIAQKNQKVNYGLPCHRPPLQEYLFYCEETGEWY